MVHGDGDRQGQEGAMERNASLFVSLAVNIVNHRPTTVDMSLVLLSVWGENIIYLCARVYIGS